MAVLKLAVITAERKVLEDEVDMVLATGTVGEMAILPNHAPLMTMLVPGELLIRKGQDEESIALGGGFMEVRENTVTILADAAERSEEIDIERAEKARQRALLKIGEHPAVAQLAEAEIALRRSLARLRVAEKRRRRERPGPRAG